METIYYVTAIIATIVALFTWMVNRVYENQIRMIEELIQATYHLYRNMVVLRCDGDSFPNYIDLYMTKTICIIDNKEYYDKKLLVYKDWYNNNILSYSKIILKNLVLLQLYGPSEKKIYNQNFIRLCDSYANVLIYLEKINDTIFSNVFDMDNFSKDNYYLNITILKGNIEIPTNDILGSKNDDVFGIELHKKTIQFISELKEIPVYKFYLLINRKITFVLKNILFFKTNWDRLEKL